MEADKVNPAVLRRRDIPGSGWLVQESLLNAIRENGSAAVRLGADGPILILTSPMDHRSGKVVQAKVDVGGALDCSDYDQLTIRRTSDMLPGAPVAFWTGEVISGQDLKCALVLVSHGVYYLYPLLTEVA